MLTALTATLLALRVLPAPAGTEGPFRQPQIAVTGNMAAVAFGAPNQVWFTRSDDGGATFNKPVKIADAKGLMLGRRRGPRIAIAGQRILVTGIAGGNVHLWTSDDKGTTWTAAPKPVNDVANAAREGFEAISASPDGKQVLITWLDVRTQGMKLYGTVSKDGGRTWEPNRLVYASPDGHICECCHTSSSIASDGTMYVMWRNYLAGNRDMYLATSKDGGKTWKEQKLGVGTWPLNACPMDGGSLLVTADGKVTTAWRRDKTVYMAVPGEKEHELGAGTQPVLVNTPKGIAALWSEGMALRILDPGATQSRVFAPHGAFVSVAGNIAVWETPEGGIGTAQIGIR